MKLDIVREGPAWAIKHNGGYLGFARTEQEAVALVRALEGPGDDDWPQPAPARRRSRSTPSRAVRRDRPGDLVAPDADGTAEPG